MRSVNFGFRISDCGVRNNRDCSNFSAHGNSMGKGVLNLGNRQAHFTASNKKIEKTPVEEAKCSRLC